MRDEFETKRNELEGGKAANKTAVPLPGVVAIGLYMLVLAAVVTFDVIGRHIPAFLLILTPVFVAASFGLLRMYRWAWALTLAAVFLLMSWYFWMFASTRESMAVVMGVLNLALFFYLARMDVRRRLR